MKVPVFELIEEKLKEKANIILEISELMFIRNLSKQYSRSLIDLDYAISNAKIDHDIFQEGENIAEYKSGYRLCDRLAYSCDNKIDNRLEKLSLIENELKILRES